MESTATHFEGLFEVSTKTNAFSVAFFFEIKNNILPRIQKRKAPKRGFLLN